MGVTILERHCLDGAGVEPAIERTPGASFILRRDDVDRVAISPGDVIQSRTKRQHPALGVENRDHAASVPVVGDVIRVGERRLRTIDQHVDGFVIEEVDFGVHGYGRGVDRRQPLVPRARPLTGETVLQCESTGPNGDAVCCPGCRSPLGGRADRIIVCCRQGAGEKHGENDPGYRAAFHELTPSEAAGMILNRQPGSLQNDDRIRKSDSVWNDARLTMQSAMDQNLVLPHNNTHPVEPVGGTVRGSA